MTNHSPLHQARLQYQPKLPKALHHLQNLQINYGEIKPINSEVATLFPKTKEQKQIFFTEGSKGEHAPLRVGAVFSGGQAAGGHNVLSGLFDSLKSLNPNSQLFGFLDGPSGIVSNAHIEMTKEIIDAYRNQGGFDLLGSGRTKIETPEQFEGAAKTASDLKLDGMVIIGGDDSNTNAAFLAEYFRSKDMSTRVVGIPKTIDGDLKSEEIEVSFGFDTAVKTFSETIGNISRDTLSAKKYYYFIKLMGRSASHIALECALQTHPNLTFIGEEIAEKKRTLKDLTNEICDLICARAEQKKNYGVILIPEGIIEFIPEFKELISECNRVKERNVDTIKSALSPSSLQCFESIPKEIQKQLLIDRDPHGNVQVSKIETERLFIESVKQELKDRQAKGKYVGKFSAQPLFCGYEGRSCLPTNFDSDYCYSLGSVASLLIDGGATGYIACVKNLTQPTEEWEIAGIPIAGMIHMEERKGKMKPVIKKALVELEGAPFSAFKEKQKNWGMEDQYRYPGPIQFFGPPEMTDSKTFTLHLEKKNFPCDFLLSSL